LGGLWTTDKILELAPDAASASAAEGLAEAGAWSGLGYDARAVWGQCQGSGKNPYQTRIDLNGPAFKCSCPSRKFPCKHGLALFLLYVDSRKSFKEGAPPSWVSEWLAGRDARVQKREQQQEVDARRPPDADAQAKRVALREEKIEAGLEELSLWLGDLLRQGLAWAHTQPPSYWQGMAARLVDAQATGLSNRIKRMGQISASGRDWQARLLVEVARTYLLIEAYRHPDRLDSALWADVRSLVGWTVPKEELMDREAVHDRWLVLGRQVEQQEQLQVQRTWLWGEATRRFALILDFAVGNAVPDRSLMPGTRIEADLVFYPSGSPLRAVVKERVGEAERMQAAKVECSVEDMLDGYAQEMARLPWTETIPVFLSPLRIVHELMVEGNVSWYGRDANAGRVDLPERFLQGWHVLSVSGGRPITFFGLWDGRAFLPLSFFHGEKFYECLDWPAPGLRCVG
jgi:hypothetical protein